MSGLTAPKLTMSSEVSFCFENLRMVRQGPRNASGGIIALTREPSLSRASTRGELSSIRLPSGETIRSMADITALSLLNTTLVLVNLPAFSMYISSNLLTMISVISSCARSTSNGPRPTASFNTSTASFSRSTSAGNFLSISLIISLISFSTW